MGTFHLVRPGECMATIAHAYGYSSPDELYRHADNAALRERRADPNVLAPGDRVAIPDGHPSATRVRVRKGQTNRLVADVPRTPVRLQLRDQRGGTLANRRFQLDAGGLVIDGQTDGDGWLEARVPLDVRQAAIAVWIRGANDPWPTRWTLAIGDLDPLDARTGVAGRLRNLGFTATDPADAIRMFQIRAGLSATGEADAQTLSKLREAHGER
jgi:hypothetical protein